MKRTLLMLVASLSLVTPCLSQAERFTTDRPGPLKLVKPGKQDDGLVHFRGNVQISGRFQIAWELIRQKPGHLRVAFLPDKESAQILPHAAGSAPVKELTVSNPEQAASLLLDRATAEKILAKELVGAEGQATVTIGDYRTVVECDHRWYLAQLISVARNQEIVVGAREGNSSGC